MTKKIFLLLILLLLPLTSAQAQTPLNGLSFDVSAGFDGYAKQNTWIPLMVHAENVGAAVSGEIHARSDYPGETYATSLNLPTQSQKNITLLVPNHGLFTVEFVAENGDVLFKKTVNPRQLAPMDFLMGVVSDTPDLLGFVAGLSNPMGGVVTVAHLGVDEIPADFGALGAFDALVFNNVDTTGLSSAQRDALTAWVVSGGRLVIGGGPNAGITVAGLQSLLPAGEFLLENINSLDNLAHLGGKPIPNAGPFVAAVPQSIKGKIELAETDAPLWVRQPLGEGEVSYFALDFSLAPLDGWAGNNIFWEKLLGTLQTRQPFFTGYAAPQAINDVLANISGAGLPSPVRFTAFLCFYFLFLVPINYFVLKRMKRRELAWLTIPAMILVFTLIGYAIGFRNRGSDTILRQLSVVWQPAGSEQATETAFLGIFSPERARFTLEFPADALVQPADGGNGFRGVKRGTSAATTVFYGSKTEFRNLFTDIGSMSTVMAQRPLLADVIELRLETVDRANSPHISGTIINHGQKTLTNAALFSGEYGYRLGDVPPGETAINAPMQRVDTTTYSGQSMWGENYDQIPVDDRLRDQTVRAILWGDYYNSRPVPMSGATNARFLLADDAILLTGWHDNVQSDLVTVKGKRVVKEAQELRVVAVAGGVQ